MTLALAVLERNTRTATVKSSIFKNKIISKMGKSDNNNLNVNSVSRISAGTYIKGEISSSNDLRIDGRFEGRIYSEGRIVIGEKAEVTGDIICANIDIWGRISGNVYVKDTLTVKSGSAVDGVIRIKKLAIELDSSFNGTCKMITEEEYDKIASSMQKK